MAASRPLPSPAVNAPADIIIREHNFRRPCTAPASARGYSYARDTNGEVHVSWSELFDFVVSADGSEIDVYSDPAPTREFVYTQLITQIMSIALLQKGIESFHASAVELDGHAIALIGESGYGKSTLTAALLLRGARLITDDLLVVEQSAGAFSAVRGAGRLKLLPATAERLNVDWLHSPMSDGSGKHIYLLPDACWSADSVQLDHILMLRPGSEDVSIERLTPASATPQLLAAVFNPLHTPPTRLQGLLGLCRDIATSVQCAELQIPRDLDRLSEVVSAIRQ